MPHAVSVMIKPSIQQSEGEVYPGAGVLSPRIASDIVA
jgi:hypothetical protein